MRGKRRPPEERVSNVAGPLPPCRVCGEPAAGFHYGVNTCEACKGFFRRSLIRGGDYECIGSDNCVIGHNRRKSCPKCRYLKCLEVGMSKEAIKTGRYTYLKRTQDTMEIKRLQKLGDKGSITTDDDTTTKDSSLSSDLGENSMSCTSTASSPKPTPVSVPQKRKLDLTKSCRGPNSLSSPSGSSDSAITSPLSALTSPQSVDADEETVLSPAARKRGKVKAKKCEDQNVAGSGASDSNWQKDLLDTVSSQSSSSSLSARTLDCMMQSPICTSLLSPQSGEESIDSPLRDSYVHSSRKPPSPSSSTNCTLSPPDSADPASLGGSSESISQDTWRDYSEAELDEMIEILVKSHKKCISDLNSLPEEFFKANVQKCKEKCHLEKEIFGLDSKLDRAEHGNIYRATGLDIGGYMANINYAAQRMDADIRDMIAFMKLIPGFKYISLPDQTALVKACIYDMFLLGYYRGYNKKEYIVVEFTRSYCEHQMQFLYSTEFLNEIFNFTHKIQELDLSFEMIVVLKALCLFFTDRADLEEPTPVERLQYKVAQCLLLLLKREYSDQAGLMFSRIISIVTLARSFAEECKHFMKVLCSDNNSDFNSSPILVELFSGNMC